jgi:hypothetical protein
MLKEQYFLKVLVNTNFRSNYKNDSYFCCTLNNIVSFQPIYSLGTKFRSSFVAFNRSTSAELTNIKKFDADTSELKCLIRNIASCIRF